ncbi:MAG TPA: hypothetical protein VNA31_11505 [bacterium]|nr:hypothetical protein [bacterium]
MQCRITSHLLLRQPLVITLGAMLSLLPTTRADGQAAPEGPAIPSMPFDISPYAGVFAPLGSMFVPGNCGASPCRYQSQGLGPPTVALQTTIAVGSQLTVWPKGRWGIEATLAYAPSGVTMGCRVSDCNAGHVVVASAKVVVPLIGGPSRRSFYVGGGVGFVGLGGKAYNGVDGTTSVAGTMAAGVELWATSAAPVRIVAEAYLFRPPFRLETCDASDGVCRLLPPTSWTEQLQHPVILSIGWVFRGGGRGR